MMPRACVKAANGMLAWVPVDKLEEWQKTQEEIRKGTYVKNEEDEKQFEMELKKALGIEDTDKEKEGIK